MRYRKLILFFLILYLNIQVTSASSQSGSLANGSDIYLKEENRLKSNPSKTPDKKSNSTISDAKKSNSTISQPKKVNSTSIEKNNATNSINTKSIMGLPANSTKIIRRKPVFPLNSTVSDTKKLNSTSSISNSSIPVSSTNSTSGKVINGKKTSSNSQQKS
jgi:hypothetical protein